MFERIHYEEIPHIEYVRVRVRVYVRVRVRVLVYIRSAARAINGSC